MESSLVPNGTYTVILDPDNSDAYVTLRLKDHWLPDKPNRVAEFLSGPDNNDNYTGFAFVLGRTVLPWRKLAGATDQLKALKILLSNGTWREAGEAYAIRSGNCFCCGRRLTVPASLHQGLGPVCAEKMEQATQVAVAVAAENLVEGIAQFARQTNVPLDDHVIFDEPVTPQSGLPSMADVLGLSGVIARTLPGYEARPQQIEAAQLIAEGIIAKEHVIVEAGTGVGKSLAYLIPAIYSRRKTIVSTGDKNLQDQLWRKDVPFLKDVLPVQFSAAILKGKNNYLCADRYTDALGAIDLQGGYEFELVRRWVENTESGDIEELPFSLSADLQGRITSTSDACTGKHCAFYQDCYAEKAKSRADQSDVVIVNHTLLCLDAAIRAKSDGYASALPDRELVIVDECFPAGTMIDGRPIETIQVGDTVTAFNDKTGEIVKAPVTRLFKRPVGTQLVRFTTVDGREVICTPNHPIYTYGGWKPAIMLTSGDALLGVSTIQEGANGNDFHLYELRRRSRSYEHQDKIQLETSGKGVLLRTVQTNGNEGSVGSESSSYQSPVRLCSDEGEQSDAQARDQGQNESCIVRDETSAQRTGRQRSQTNDPSADACQCAEMADGSCGCNKGAPEQFPEITDLLQAGHRKQGTNDRDRDRRTLSSSIAEAGPRQEKGDVSFWVRVDSVKVLESASDPTFGGLCPGCVVYNLEVEGVHTYTANGLIVHNCHRLEDAATLAFTTELSATGILRLLHDKHVNAAKVAADTIDHIEGWVDTFFGDLAKLSQSMTYAINEPPQMLLVKAEKLANALYDLAKELERLNPYTGGEGRDQEAYKKFVQRIKDMSGTIETILLPSTGHVVYVEKRQGQRRQLVYLKRCPISVADDLRESLFENWPVICTSATLATGDSFSYFKSRVGCDEARELVVGSPFDYKHNALIYLPPNGKEFDPTRYYQEGSPEYFDRLAAQMEQLLLASDGRAFCLFTSNKALNEVYNRIAHRLRWTVLKQGDMPRAELVKRFKEDGHAVLWGLKSFWEGVDVQGEALSLVIIDKIPFGMPDDPIYDARCKAIVAETGDKWSWFSKLALPTAIITYKQGFGRLIRTKADRGVVALLDGRISTKNYGTTVLRSLPPATQTRSMDVVKAFFER